MSKTRKQTIALSAVLLLLAAALVVAVRMQRQSEQGPAVSTPQYEGPYRLIGAESEATVKMFGQKTGWISVRFPVESVLVSGGNDGLNMTTALRWSQASFDPEIYQGTYLEVFRPGHLVENRFEFLLSQVPVPAVGSTTDVTLPAHVMLYGQQKQRTIDAVVSRSPERLSVRTRTLATMDLEDFRADKLSSLLAVQSGASVSPLVELRFNLVFEPNAPAPTPAH